MTTQLIKGQNIVWPAPQLRIEIHTSAQCDVSALLLGVNGKVRDSADFVFYNQPEAAGVSWRPGPPQQLVFALDRLEVEAIACLVSVDPQTPPFGAGPAPLLRFFDAAALPLAEFIPTGLSSERALIVCEVYRRAGQWKLRAVGQGYDGGLAAAVTAHGVDVDDPPPQNPPDATAFVPPTTHSGAAVDSVTAGIEEQRRLFDQSTAIMDDASRSTASLQSTIEYAKRQQTQAFEAMLAGDPALRSRAVTEPALTATQRQYDRLVDTATANHRRDMAQLTAELAGWEQRLPPSMAAWSSPAWTSWQPPTTFSVAVRVGEMSLPEAPTLRVPFLLRLPIRRPIWIDADLGGPQAAAVMLRSTLARLLTGYPAEGLVVSVAALGNPDPSPLRPLGLPGCRVQPEPAARTLAELTQLLERLVAHYDRMEMAREAGMPEEVDGRDRLLVITDFPTGFDDRCLGLLRHLIDVGLSVLTDGTDSQAVPSGPLASTLFKVFFRVPAGEGGGMTDGFGGVDWHFTPDLGPADAQLVDAVLTWAGRPTTQ